jgi:predicted Zn-dependent protease with MMP-like domain
LVGSVQRAEFEDLVEEALERIPAPFRLAMHNVAIIVEDWPDPEIVEEITGDRDELIYGLFSGVSLLEQHVEDSGDLPPIIEIYQRPLEEDFPNREELVEEIEITLVHEIAHFMGLDEEQVREYGYE